VQQTENFGHTSMETLEAFYIISWVIVMLR